MGNIAPGIGSLEFCCSVRMRCSLPLGRADLKDCFVVILIGLLPVRHQPFAHEEGLFFWCFCWVCE